MRKIFLIFIIAVLFSNCSVSQDCPEGINKLPMYGKVKKCSDQITADKKFLTFCDNEFKNRKDASNYYAKKAWDFFNRNRPDTAMMRFNQAWLLDSLNAQVYWGFANLLGMQKKYNESLVLFNKSLERDNTDANVWFDKSISLGQLFYQTKDIKYLNENIMCLKKSIGLKENNVKAYAQLTASYSYFMQKDSAKKYLNITDMLDKNAVNPEVRQIIINK